MNGDSVSTQGRRVHAAPRAALHFTVMATIPIADDEGGTRRLLSMLLQRNGQYVQAASDGAATPTEVRDV